MGRDLYRSAVKGRDEGPAGCMSGVLSFFDLHHILFTTTSTSRTTVRDSSPHLRCHYSSQLKGVEAPRNSLELNNAEADAAAAKAISASSIHDYDDYYGIPLGIELPPPPRLLKKPNKDLLLLEETRTSQSETPRTPGLVARLMGLDILPDGASTPTTRTGIRSSGPSPKKSTSKKQQCPDGPRKDSSPRRQPLQRRDCNVMRSSDTGSRSLPDTPRASSERPRDADPRLSLQLTNNKENYCNRVKELANYSCEASSPKTTRKKESLKSQEESKSQYYAREIVKQVKESINRRSGDENVLLKSRRTNPKSPAAAEKPQPKPKQPTGCFFKAKDNAVKKAPASYDRFNERLKKPPEAATTSTPIIKTREESSKIIAPQATRLDRRNCTRETDPEFLYVKSILERAGIMSAKPARRYSPSHPIDPFIFHQLELDLPLYGSTNDRSRLGPLRHRCNRKLLFNLVEEILTEFISWPSTNSRKKLTEVSSELLLDRLWTKVQSFPLADCQVIGDIDALVAGDMAAAKVRRVLGHPSVVAKTEEITVEIEAEVIDSIIGEAAASLALFTSNYYYCS